VLQLPEMPKDPGLLSNLIQFMKENKKWWLIPIVAVILLMGVLIALGATSAAPFIYTLF
jgi:hypothetical protein